jgi:hypothetical protein
MPNHTSARVTTDPQSAFQAFKDFVAEFDPIDLLSQLTLTFLFAPETEFIGEASPKFAWYKDEVMESAVQEFLRPGRRIDLRST